MTQEASLARIPPLEPSDAPADAREILARWPYNLHRVLARNVPTLTRWMPFAEHILRENTLPAREREIAILRVAWNARSTYEWGMHARLARSLGFSDQDLENIATNPVNTDHWRPEEGAIIEAVDDIMCNWKIGDHAWSILAAHFSSEQLIDLVFVTCQFMLVAVTLNSFQVPLEPGLEPLPTVRPTET
jgi:4-carboxymuconolactone decarboxylase